MQECQVCGLLFLGKGSCPSCGSQVANDIVLDDVSMDDDYIPGLDDVVESLGGTEESSADKESLPFGLGAVAGTIESSLPFGVGSFTDEKINYQESDLVQFEDESDFHQGDEDEDTTDEKSRDTVVPDEISENPVPTNSNNVINDDVLESEPEINLDEIEEISLVPNVQVDDEPLRLESTALPTEPIVTPIDLQDEIPDMWRIDAAEVNMEDLYAQEDKIVEVTYEEEELLSNVEVTFDDFHYSPEEESTAGDEDAPQLHPAKALPIDTASVPELSSLVSEGFEMMANQSWLRAAQIFSTISQNMQNEPSVLNNLGLTILQSALEMDAEGDTMAESQYEASIMALRQGAKVDPSNNAILLNLGHSLLVSGRAEKALGIAEVLLSRTNGDVEIVNLKGSCLIQLDREDEARQVLSPFANDTIVAGNLALI